MYQVIIEDEGAYEFCRNGKFAHKEVSWHVTSPWLLERLQEENEKVESLELNISLNQQKKIGHASILFGDLLSKRLDDFIDFSPKDYFIGRTLKHRIQFSCFVLFYKSVLLNEWYKNLEKNGKKHDCRCVSQDHAKIATSLGIEETNFKYIPTFKYLLSFVS